MYLHRRGAHWWFRKAVPSDLTGVLGMPDVRRSLRTRNAALARRRALQVLIRIDEVYAVLRSQRPMRPARDIALAMLDDAIGSVSGRPLLVERRLAFLRDVRGVFEDHARDDDGGLSDDSESAGPFIPKAEALRILEAEAAAGLPNEAAVALLKAVDRATGRSWGKTEERAIDTAMTNASAYLRPSETSGPAELMFDQMREIVAELRAVVAERAPAPDLSAFKAALSAEVRTAYSDAMTSRWSAQPLSEAIVRYDAAEIVKLDDPKHAGDVRERLANFLRFLGDKPVRNIVRDDIRCYRDALDRLPNRFELRLKTRDIRDAIELNEKRKDPFPPIGPTTVDLKYLGPVRRLLQWLADDDKIEKNPTIGLHSEQGAATGTKGKRLPFKPSQLSAFFALTAKETAVGPVYWFPPVILFTGMRLTELAQLRTDDVWLDHNGMPHFNVLSLVDDEDELDVAAKPTKADDGRRVKSAAGRRLIPVHPTLIEIGFLDFVASRRKRSGKDVQLFPELKPDKSGRYSDAISKRLNRRIRDGLKITNPRYTAYSLRHNFRDACTASGVSEEARKKAMGHQLEGMDGVYGNPLLLRHESDAVAGIRYPDVDMGPYLRRNGVSAKRGSVTAACEAAEANSMSE